MARKKGSIPWNKGLTKETDKRVKKNSESLSRTIKKQIKDGVFVPRKMGIEARQKLSLEQSLFNRGGKSKWFEVAGQKVQGTWERKLAEKFEQLNIKWYKPKCKKDVFVYILNEKEKNYTPDFYLEELDLFLEIKGFWWGNDKEKMKSVLEQNKFLKIKLVLKQELEILLKVQSKEQLYAVLAEMV